MIKRLHYFCATICAYLFFANAHAATLPQNGADTHMGVASCGTSVCHGKIAPIKDGNVALNEYRVWSTEDHHARAYSILSNELSKNIAKNLGLPNAQTAKICLDCHTDNVAVEKRGAKFRLEDGIGCESCHGGAQRWIETHTDPHTAHKANIAHGMYPTDDAYSRAQLCLSCHMGTADKFANHHLMAAGHPRLVFELDAFSTNQPAHFVVDADYQTRKGAPAPGYLWVVGQIESAKQLSALIQKHLASGYASELAIFDCHACHHPMKPPRGQPNDFSAVLPSGSLRLIDGPYDMIAAIFSALQPDAQEAWANAVRNMHRASTHPEQMPGALAEMNRQLQSLENKVRAQAPTREQIKSMRAVIAAQSAAGRYADFTSAEQAYLALDGLSYALGDRNARAAALDEIYKSVADEHTYQPTRFAQASRAFAP